MKKRIINFLDSTRNWILLHLAFCWKERKNGIATILDANKQYKNLHVGERCFILGNGPSLSTVDFTKLQHEYVFTVNQLSRHPNFASLCSNYHLWSDPEFFHLDQTGKINEELLKSMKIGKGDKYPECFFPVKQREIIEKIGLNASTNINYFYDRLAMMEGDMEDIDFCRYIPYSGTVVHYAVMLAIYMGFSEIYLCGCDSTGIVVTINSKLKKECVELYAYPISQSEQERMEGLLERNSFESYVGGYYSLLRNYRLLYKYCVKRQISFFNCSSSTVLDYPPRKQLDEVIK